MMEEDLCKVLQDFLEILSASLFNIKTKEVKVVDDVLDSLERFFKKLQE